MKKMMLALVALLMASNALAQTEIDALKVYYWTGTTQRCAHSVGSGAPSGGVDCDTYVDYAAQREYIRIGGVWVLKPALNAANTWTAAQTISGTEAILNFYETDQASGSKAWRWNATGANLVLQTMPDDFSTATSILSIGRTGTLGVASDTAIGGRFAVGPSLSTNAVAIINGTLTGNTTNANGLFVNATLSPVTGYDGRGVVIQPTFNEAGSGNHGLFSSLAVFAPTINAGAATLNDAATLYINQAPSATVSGGNYALWVDAGTTRLDGTLDAGAVTSSADIVAHGDLKVNPTAATYARLDIVGNQVGDVTWAWLGGYGTPGDLVLREIGVGSALTINKTTYAATFTGTINAASTITSNNGSLGVFTSGASPRAVFQTNGTNRVDASATDTIIAPSTGAAVLTVSTTGITSSGAIKGTYGAIGSNYSAAIGAVATGLDVVVGSGTNAFQVWDDNDLVTPRFRVTRSGIVTAKSDIISTEGAIAGLGAVFGSPAGGYLGTGTINAAGAITSNGQGAFVGLESTKAATTNTSLGRDNTKAAQVTINYTSATDQALAIRNTAASGRTWSLGDGVGVAAGTFGFYDQTGPGLRASLDSGGNFAATGGISGTTGTFTGTVNAVNGNTLANPTTSIGDGARFSLNGVAGSTNPFAIGIGAVRDSAYDIWFQTGASNGGGFRFYQGTSELVTILKGGNVGIGTTGPLARFEASGGGTQVSGNAYTNAAFTKDHTDYYGLYFGYDNTDSVGIIYGVAKTSASAIAFWTRDGVGAGTWAERMRIAPTGAVTMTSTLGVTGAATFSGGATVISGQSLATGYTAGWTGTGYTLNQAVTRTGSYLELDDLTVRGRMNVYELLVHQIRATNGSIYVANTGRVKTVTANGGASYTILTEDAHGFAVNDIIRAQRFSYSGGPATVWQSDMIVSAVADTTHFTADLQALPVPAPGMDFVRLGNTTDADRQGSVYMTADDTGAPYINVLSGVTSIATWGTTAKTRVRLGNLNGWGDYATNIYGIGIGDTAATNVTVDATNGFRIRNGTTNKFVADTSGNLSIVGDLSIGTSGVLRSGATAYATGTGIWAAYNGGTPQFRVGTTAGNRFAWDGTNLALVSSGLTIDSSGITLTSDAAFPYGTASSAYKFSTGQALVASQVISGPNTSDYLALMVSSSASLVEYLDVSSGTSGGHTYYKGQGGSLEFVWNGSAYTSTLTTSGTLAVSATNWDVGTTGNASFDGTLTTGSTLKFQGTTSPAQFTATTNNLTLAAGRFHRVSADAARDLTGIVAMADGTEIVLWNASAYTITLKHESGSSTAGNRFLLAGAADVAVTQYKAVLLRYSGTDSRWVLVQ